MLRPHRSRRAILAALATTLLAGSPAATAQAAGPGPNPPPSQPPGTQPPWSDPGDPSDAVVYPEWYPRAVLEMSPLVLAGRRFDLALDDSTGDVVDQELRIDSADGELWFVFQPGCPPVPDCWVGFTIPTPGGYTATLTVTGPGGETSSVHHDFVVFRFRPLER